MQLECLANELLLHVFEYLDGVRLFRAFYGLNNRFNHLLLSNRQNLHLNFRGIPKEDFHALCEEYLLLIIRRVISIEISDDIETPKLPDLFLDYNFTLNQFINLKSLTLHSITSLSTLIKLTFGCQDFPNLERFNMTNCVIDNSARLNTGLFNNIWLLPKLTQFNYDAFNFTVGDCLLKVSHISPTIQSLTLENCELFGLHHLLKYIPNLQRLKIRVEDLDYFVFNTIVSSLTYLDINFNGHDSILISIFQCLPNLLHLSLRTDTSWDGHKWKEVIETYLPKLKQFQFFILYSSSERYRSLDHLLNTFRTWFWIEEHRWFVASNLHPKHTHSYTALFTLPYVVNDRFSLSNLCFKSTCFNEEYYYSFDHVRSLEYYDDNPSVVDNFPLHFPNIDYLYIAYPMHYEYLSCLFSLKRLRSLAVRISKEDDYAHVQTLLNDTPCLYSLALNGECRSYKGLFQLTSSSVRKLDLFPAYFGCDLKSQDYMRFISSPLGRQCEVLSVNINNRMDILDFIQQMSNLRSVSFYYTNIKCSSVKKERNLLVG